MFLTQGWGCEGQPAPRTERGGGGGGGQPRTCSPSDTPPGRSRCGARQGSSSLEGRAPATIRGGRASAASVHVPATVEAGNVWHLCASANPPPTASEHASVLQVSVEAGNRHGQRGAEGRSTSGQSTVTWPAAARTVRPARTRGCTARTALTLRAGVEGVPRLRQCRVCGVKPSSRARAVHRAAVEHAGPLQGRVDAGVGVGARIQRGKLLVAEGKIGDLASRACV